MNRHEHYEVRFAADGGQGAISAGKLLAEAACKHFDHVSAVATYGPEVRGTPSSAGVILSSKPIAFPAVSSPDCLVVTNQRAYDCYSGSVKKDGITIYDSTVFKPDCKIQVITPRHAGCPATKMASENGGDNRSAIIVLLCFMCKETGIIPLESISETLIDKGFTENIVQALFIADAK